MVRRRRKVKMCSGCGAPALKWAPVCEACHELGTIIEVSVAELEKRQREKVADLPPEARAVVERLCMAWRIQERRLESAVTTLIEPRPAGTGLALEQLTVVAEEAIRQHANDPKRNPVGYLIMLARQMVAGEAIGQSDGLVKASGSAWESLATDEEDGGASLRPLGAVLPDAAEAPAPPQVAAACPDCRGHGYRVVDLPDEGAAPRWGTAECECRKETPEKRTARLLRYSQMEGALLEMRLDNLEPLVTLEPALRAAGEFMAGGRPQLVLTGVTGCGKTHIAAGIAHLLIERGRPVVFMNVARYLDELRASYDASSSEASDSVLMRVMSCPVLIIDDLGAERGTAWAREKLYEIIDSGYVRGQWILASSNNEPETWDPRVRSRLCDWQRSVVVTMKAPDYRLRRIRDGSESAAPVGTGGKSH